MERILFKLKSVKNDFFCFFDILRIIEDASSCEKFDPTSAIKKWCIDKVTCTTAKKVPRRFKSLNSANANVRSVSEDANYTEEGNISENGN